MLEPQAPGLDSAPLLASLNMAITLSQIPVPVLSTITRAKAAQVWAWPSAPADQAQWPDEIPSELDPNYRDTGRGWSVASRPVREEAPAFVQRMSSGPRAR